MIRIPGDIDRYIVESKIDLIREKNLKKLLQFLRQCQKEKLSSMILKKFQI